MSFAEGVPAGARPSASLMSGVTQIHLANAFATFTDAAYAIGSGRITPLTVWQLEKVFTENEFQVRERPF